MISNIYPEKLVECSKLMWKKLWIDNCSIHTDENINEVCIFFFLTLINKKN